MTTEEIYAELTKQPEQLDAAQLYAATGTKRLIDDTRERGGRG